VLAAANVAPVALGTPRNASCGHRTAPGNMTSLAMYPENMGKPRGWAVLLGVWEIEVSGKRKKIQLLKRTSVFMKPSATRQF
jgi:hypothetical protein